MILVIVVQDRIVAQGWLKETWSRNVLGNLWAVHVSGDDDYCDHEDKDGDENDDGDDDDDDNDVDNQLLGNMHMR